MHHEAMLQDSSDVYYNVVTSLQDELRKHKDLLAQVITPHQRKVIESFVQSPEDYFDAQPTFRQSSKASAPASGEIFGILKQMKETFETNLANSQKEEVANVQTYEDLKAAKLQEIEASTKQVEMKTGEAATADEKRAA